MSSLQDSKNSGLKKAVEKNDIDFVRSMLDQGADPNYVIQSKTKLYPSPMTQDHAEIVKLFVQHGLSVQRNWLREMFDEPACRDYAKDIVTCILNHHKKESKIFHAIFDGLVTSKRKDVDMLEFLIDQGLPINELYGYDNLLFEDALAPLHHCIPKAKYDYVRNFN